jgi:glucosamine-phosphate N-acetyltransferase|tara:strand:- start:319 stop:741 length:423 start_codon:yes stop_codon:yes gene_type:complete
MLRKLKLSDYKLSFFELLSQLTITTDCNEKKFIEQFNNLKSSDLHLVIEQDGKIIAYGAIIIDFKFYRNFRNVGHIEDIVIHKDYRGNNYSKIIIDELIKYGESMNCYKIVLNCDNKLKSFYKKFNFTEKGSFLVKSYIY